MRQALTISFELLHVTLAGVDGLVTSDCFANSGGRYCKRQESDVARRELGATGLGE